MDKEINVRYLLLLTLVAALGGLLFGFDIAIITGAGPFIEEHFDLNELQLGWGFSSLLFGCIVGALVAGRITDLYGRKKVLLIVALLFSLTTVGTGLAPDFTTFVVARMLGGLAVGGASMLSPMYIAEVSPRKVRGSLVSVYQLSIVTGIMVSYLINYLLHDIGEHNWRWMFASGVIPSAIFFILLLIVPETPRFLYKIGREDEAFGILKRISGKGDATRSIEEIKESFSEKRVSLREVLKPKYRKMMIVGIGLAIFVQLSGINAIIDYAPRIFRSTGWNIDAALFATFGLGIVNILFTFVSIWAIDRFGRKPLYIVGSAGMAIALMALSIFKAAGHFEGTIVLVICIVYLAFFASCIGPVFWTLVSELFPNKIRGTAMSVPVFVQWFFNGVVVLLFPWMFAGFPVSSFAILGIMAFAQMLFAYRLVPETKGKSLEEIEKHWEV